MVPARYYGGARDSLRIGCLPGSKFALASLIAIKIPSAKAVPQA